MTAFMLMDIDIKDPQEYATYPPQVWPLIEKHGGKITHRISDFDVLEGDWLPKRVVLAIFPDKAAVKAFMEDPEYQPLKEIRLRAATSLIVVGDSEM
ncbi:MAG: DUF1330 domain-containing protein [Parahaliea sp.]